METWKLLCSNGGDFTTRAPSTTPRGLPTPQVYVTGIRIQPFTPLPAGSLPRAELGCPSLWHQPKVRAQLMRVERASNGNAEGACGWQAVGGPGGAWYTIGAQQAGAELSHPPGSTVAPSKRTFNQSPSNMA